MISTPEINMKIENSDYGNNILDWEDSRPQEFSFLKHMFAGSMAGIMEHCGMFPFDTVKTHMQAQRTKLGFFGTIRKLYSEYGAVRFYKGVNVIASGCIPAHACYFSTYEVAKEKFGIDDGNTHFLVSGWIGALATLSHDAFLTPSDCIKQRMQLNTLTTIEWLKKTIREEGFFALYRSYPMTIFMNVPFAFMIVSANENIKVYANPQQTTNPLLTYFGCAFIAGMIAAFITNPMDVVKTRLQIQNQWSWLEEGKEVKFCTKINAPGDLPTEGRVELKYTSVRDTVAKVYQQDGIRGFYRGVMPRMMFVSPGVAISWGTYEFFKSMLIKPN